MQLNEFQLGHRYTEGGVDQICLAIEHEHLKQMSPDPRIIAAHLGLMSRHGEIRVARRCIDPQLLRPSGRAPLSFTHFETCTEFQVYEFPGCTPADPPPVVILVKRGHTPVQWHPSETWDYASYFADDLTGKLVDATARANKFLMGF